MLLDTPQAEIGTPAPAFKLQSTDGDWVSLGDVAGDKGTLVAFICNHCPYVIAIIDRLVADAKQLQASGINVVAICSNDAEAYPADSPENMQAFAAQHGFTFPYLIDSEQSVARAYGAVCTPDFFGYNAHQLLQYRGRLDDAKMKDATNRTPELVNAMLEIAESGQGPRDQIASMGCSIKWK